MIVFRNAVQVAICDGCSSVIRSVDGSVAQFARWRCSDGREGHACTPECGAKFEQAATTSLANRAV